VTHLLDDPVVCPTSGCDVVARSDYAELAGVPLALLGLGAYVGVLTTAIVRSGRLAATGAAVALGGLVFSGYLAYVQLAVLDAVCVWCVASDMVMTALAAATLVRVWRLSVP
jgi:uncharacterized membrane protein